MHILFLALFPILYLFNTYLALASLGVAIVLIYRGRMAKAERPRSSSSARVEDHSI